MFFNLPHFQMLTLEGRDAVVFAQAQFSNDLNSIEDQQWQWNAWLTPKGRVIALFLVIKVSNEQLYLLLPDYAADAFKEQLQRFILRRKVQLQTCNEFHIMGSWHSSEHAVLQNIHCDNQGIIELTIGNAKAPRTLKLIPKHLNTIETNTTTETTITSKLWEISDIISGIPRLLDNQSEQWTPQQLGLQRLNAFSVKKGCYPGQEIVARTHFLGKAKRTTQLILLPPSILDSDLLEIKDKSLNVVGSVIQSFWLEIKIPESLQNNLDNNWKTIFLNFIEYKALYSHLCLAILNTEADMQTLTIQDNHAVVFSFI